MKKLVIPAVFALILIMCFSYIVVSQTTGTFTVGNEPPYVVANTFAVQDSATTWDNTPSIDTHDKNTNFRFNVDDNNPDTLDVRLCIGNMSEPSTTGDCNVVNYEFLSITPGTEINYEYNVDPTGTLEGDPDIIRPVNCGPTACGATYYVDIIINDNQGGITTDSYQFNIMDQRPLVPSGLTPTETHDQTPDLTWTSTDPDDGTIDRWPADTLIYHIQVGTTNGDETYLSDPSSATPSATVANPIPWGTPGTLQARTTAYARIWSTDDFGINSSSFYDTSFDLVDNLPQFVNVSLGDDYASLQPCTIPLQNCFVNPDKGTNSSISMLISFNDADMDCSEANHNANLVLCLVDTGSPDLCDLTNNDDYSYTLLFENQAGENCNFSVTFPEEDPSGIEFFQLPGIYKMYIEAESQAGMSTSFPTAQEWEYKTLYGPDYPYAAVYLGDRIEDGGDGIQLGLWNPGLFLATMTNQGNSVLNLDWEATDPEEQTIDPKLGCSSHTSTCWDLSTNDDFQIDDDNIQGEVTETLLNPANIPESPSIVNFQPGGGLDICISSACDDPVLNETLDTYYHIMPPTGLQAGTYETIIYFQTS